MSADGTKPKSQARLAAETIIRTFWLGQVDRIARCQVERHSTSPISMYPPTEADYAGVALFLESLMTPTTTELALAVPETPKSKRKRGGVRG